MTTTAWSTEPPGTTWSRAVIHVDLDAFYASVEQLRRPELRGKPVIVGGGANPDGTSSMTRGVVSAASYEARTFGVRSAMPLARAVRLCPQATVVPVDFVAYRAASREVFAIFAEFTPLIEPLSLDEAYLDVTASIRRFGAPLEISRAIRDRIDAHVHLSASFGIGSTKTIAKIASDFRKPRGLVIVPPGQEAEFLAPLPVRRMPGLGPATETSLQGLGITTLGQLAALPIDVVTRRLGNHSGTSLWGRARGLDESEVSIPVNPKSVSREETFDSDVQDEAKLRERLRLLAANVGGRLRHDNLAGRTVTIKLRYGDFTTLSRQRSLTAASDGDVEIADAAHALFESAWTGAPVRLLGVGVTGIEERSQLDLFAADISDSQSNNTAVDRALDEVRARFGPHAAHRGMAADLRDLDFRGEDLREMHPDDN